MAQTLRPGGCRMSDAQPLAKAVADTAETLAAAPSILRNRHFLLLWLSQATSQIGQNALVLGLLVLVERLTHSPTHLSVATLALVVPSVLFGLLAGVVVDRLNKRTVLVATNFLRVVSSLAYVLMNGSLALIYLVTFFFASVGQFFGPAEAAAIPLLVRREQLIAANSLFNLTLNASQLVGLVIVAPLLIKLVGVTGFFITLALLFVVATVCVALLPSDTPALFGVLNARRSRRMMQGVWADLRRGWRILRKDEVASLSMLHLTLLASLVPLIAVLGPIFAVAVIRTGPEDVVYLFAPAGIGMFVTTALLGRLVTRLGKIRVMTYGLVGLGVALVAIGSAKTGGSYLLYNVLGRVVDTRFVALEFIPIVMVLSFAMGVGFVCVGVPAQTLLQERCPPAFRGRIFGVQFTLSGAGSILPLLGAGGIADLLGVNKTVFAIGISLIVIGLVGGRALDRLAPAAGPQ